VPTLPQIYANYGVYVTLSLLLLLLVLAIWTFLLHRSLTRVRHSYSVLLSNSNGEDLGKLLGEQWDEIQPMVREVEELSSRSRQMERQLTKTTQRIGLVRFDAFEGTGGQQSFALAMLDAEGDGIVVSSLHGRGQSRVYAKPIKHRKSTYSLSTEERQAIAQADEDNVDRAGRL
jgi:hypothetical protein